MAEQDVAMFVDRALRAADRVEDVHVETLRALIELSDTVKKNEASLTSEQLCDAGFMCRQMERWADELRKEAKARRERLAYLIAYRAAQAVATNPTAETTVRGKYATGTPDVKVAAGLPKRDTPEYAKLCEWLGVSEEAQKSGAIRFHFNTLMDIVSERIAAGQDVPPGITKTYSMFVTKFIARRRAK